MVFPFSAKPRMISIMKAGWMTLLAAMLTILPAFAQIQRQERKSNLDSDPEVVYFDGKMLKPLELGVIKAAPVFSDREGKHRLGMLKSNQIVKLEAITDKVYRVRGQGTHDGIAGWVAPWAFTAKEPDFQEQLKQLYERQIQVQSLIAAKEVAIGMSLEEVTLSKGKPTKTSIRKTVGGQSGRWEFIEYDEVKHYATRVNPQNGTVYRVLSHVTQVERGKLVVEFENDLVTAIEESTNNQGGNVRIVVPPVVFGW